MILMVKENLYSKSRPAGRMDRDCKEAVALARKIYYDAMRQSKPDLSQVDLDRGFEVSKSATDQPIEVPITPIMKNILAKFNPEFGNGKAKLTIYSELTEGEKWLDEQVRNRLVSFNGPETSTYDESIPLRSKSHYDVDCWRNYKDNMRQVQPGQEKTRRELAKMYTMKMDPEPIFRIFESEKVAKLAFSILFDSYPSVSADTEFKETSAPFESKHTNVGFPWWMNDRNVDPVSGLTYAKLALKTAQSQNLKTIFRYNINTYYGRNQRGKGRLISATSRVANLFLNRLEAREIEALKSVSYFQGYGNDEVLKKALISILNLCEQKGLKCKNFDQSKYDMHINPAWLAIVGALRSMKARGALGKNLAEIRAMMNIHSWVVDGMTGEVEELFGRMPSGFIDTNQGDSLVSILIMLIGLLEQDLDYTKKIAITRMIYLLVMGDDSLATYDPAHFNLDTFITRMKALGFEVSSEKGEFGVFFLQHRLFEYKGELVMVYPWTRVLRSMLFTEKNKGLGPFGWLLAQYQQLSKLEECPEALDCVISILYKFDKLKFGADLSVDQILEGIKQEDKAAAEQQKANRYSSTVEKLFDGDPNKSTQYIEDSDGNLTINPTYLEKIHKAVRDSVRRVESSGTDKQHQNSKTAEPAVP